MKSHYYTNALRIHAEKRGQEAAWNDLAYGTMRNNPYNPFSQKEQCLSWRQSYDQAVRQYWNRKEMECAK